MEESTSRVFQDYYYNARFQGIVEDTYTTSTHLNAFKHIAVDCGEYAVTKSNKK